MAYEMAENLDRFRFCFLVGRVEHFIDNEARYAYESSVGDEWADAFRLFRFLSLSYPEKPFMNAKQQLGAPTCFDDITLQSIEAAAGMIVSAGLTVPTPAIRWPLLEEGFGGAELWVKQENHLPTGAFKVRGGVRYFDWLRQAHPEVRDVIAATRGNHGQSVAFAAAACGLKAVLVVPLGNSPEKNRAMRAYGAELIEQGSDFNEALEVAAELAGVQGLHLVPSFDWKLVEGVATYGLEMFRQVPELDRLYVPIGLGSGVCGCLAARRALALERRTEIVGVVADRAPCYALSMEAGEVVETSGVPQTVADGVACRVPNPQAFGVIRNGVSRILSIKEELIVPAMARLLRDTGQIAEGAAALSFAGALQDLAAQPAGFPGKRIGVVVSGGNVSAQVMRKLLID